MKKVIGGKSSGSGSETGKGFVIKYLFLHADIRKFDSINDFKLLENYEGLYGK